MAAYHSSVSTLHITNGDSAAGTLRTFLTDPVLVTCDVLHDGPAPLVDDDAWYDTRARFLTDGFGARFEETRADLAAFDRAIAGSAAYDEMVLWFEHDLFDQLLLIRTLDLIGRLRRTTTLAKASLICIGEFPGVDRFVGLGQLTADQLASLYPRREPVADDQVAAASAAWAAFRSDDPTRLYRVLSDLEARDTQPLPFLPGAIRRLFEEYPSTTIGLSRSAAAVLRALAAGPLEGGRLFMATQAGEARPFMGDWGLFDVVRDLASPRAPLVTITPPTDAVDLRGHTIALTQTGAEVLDGQRDAVAIRGIDEWRGGVHLVGADRSPWRWDPARETLVS
jgi:uncharacterized protein DUF1835